MNPTNDDIRRALQRAREVIAPEGGIVDIASKAINFVNPPLLTEEEKQRMMGMNIADQSKMLMEDREFATNLAMDMTPGVAATTRASRIAQEVAPSMARKINKVGNLVDNLDEVPIQLHDEVNQFLDSFLDIPKRILRKMPIDQKIAEFRGVMELPGEGFSVKNVSPVKAGDIPVERYGESWGLEGRMGESTFFSPVGKGSEEFGSVKTEGFISGDAKLYEGSSSWEYAQKNNLMNKKSDLVKNITGLDTLAEVEEAYALGVPKKFDFNGKTVTPNAKFRENPNIYYTAFQQTAARDLKSKGFHGAFWSSEDELLPTQYQIWDKSKVKPKNSNESGFIDLGAKVGDRSTRGEGGRFSGSKPKK